MLNPRLEHLGGYPFRRLDALLDADAPPDPAAVLSMALGEPQHPTPPLLTETLAAHGTLWNRYPPVAGTSDFRQAVAAWLIRRYDLPEGSVHPDHNVLPLAGTKEGLYMLASVVVGERADGRRPAVLVPNPFYNVYLGAAVMAGAEPVYLPATAESGFLPELEALEPELLERTALFYLTSPGNPQGMAADMDYLRQAVALARRFEFVLVLDECYAELYYDLPPPGGLAAAIAEDGSFDNVLVMHSLSKRSNAAGLRSGFVAGDARLIKAFAHLRSYGAATPPLPVIHAATALWRDEAHVIENRALYARKFEMAERRLGNRFGFYRPDGGFFLWLEVGDGEAVARRLWREAGLKVLPGSYLGRDDPKGGNPGRAYIRLALVHTLPEVEEAFDRLVSTLT
ncbi:aminotransferase class I/II-fold pyridoxal phosphate-dependent enzyme [Marinivivus vitaminiproducens]|uniref:aminotransferase class I/II-fold pyridoxal phosphate-dependent enzyme n=1 Tax=Marinivivus vitaminiproducens TaxID=3035935 RepID=UPI00279E3CD1|nr:aminotransferase class I/II-fold pyridoxal phosphate-dependent enzyme [Geminicoccaceae bacterium SCSIO 64248]